MNPDTNTHHALPRRTRRHDSLPPAYSLRGPVAPAPTARTGPPLASHRATDFDARACEREAERLAERLARSWAGSRADAPGRDGRLPDGLRRHFERLLGHSFDRVHLHLDGRAAKAAARLGARAFTVGADVFFAAGEYRPDTHAGLRLLAHELVHVVQQGAVVRLGGGAVAVSCRAPRTVQCNIRPSEIYRGVCPPGTQPRSYSSSTEIGTAYGQWLGIMYMLERKPKPYGLVDFKIWWRSKSWFGGTVYDLWKYDPGVALAFMNLKTRQHGEFPRRGQRRADILDAERDEVYEIKPLRSVDLAPAQFNGYIQQLNQTASMTTRIFGGPPRRRVWHGGDWDPSRYPMIVPGRHGEACLIHAWRDPVTPGVLVYDIVCCVPEDDDDAEAGAALAATVITGVIAGLTQMRPQLQALLKDYLPRAAHGSSYAFLMPRRSFETFVMHPADIEQSRMLERMYGTRLGPVHQKFLAELFVLSHLLPTAPLTDVLFVNSGFMSGEDVLRLWGYQALAGAVIGACVVALPAAAAAAPEVAAVAEAVVAAEAAAAPLAAGETLAAATTIPTAASPLLTGDIIVSAEIAQAAAAGGEAVAAAETIPPWMISSGLSAGSGAGAAAGLGGIVAVIAAALVPANAEASQPSPAKIIGADPLHLVPVELLAPKRGVIELGAEVNYGGEQYFIIGLAAAK